MTYPTGTLAGNVAAALLPFRMDGLISDDSRERIATAAALLPAAASNFFGFECRLNEPEASVDFLACISADPGRQAWTAKLPPPGLGDEAPWRRLAAFVHDWADPASTIHQPVINMWVEFDLVASPTLVPSVFVGNERLGRAQSDPEGHAWLIAALERLSGVTFASPLKETLRTCLARLPADGHLFQVGMMLSRPDVVVRLCFKKIPSADIVDFLVAVGWRGDEAGLRALIGEVQPLVDDVTVDVDVGDGIRQKVGLECYLRHLLKCLAS